MRIAVLGAGIQGACAALELADRGAHVDLFDFGSTPISRASLWNEGKIHLGYVYANDAAERTAHLLQQGAFAFELLLGNFVDVTELRQCRSKPFTYLVHRDSLLSVSEIESHFAAVTEFASAEARHRHYFDLTRINLPLKLSPAEQEEFFCRDQIQAAFQTDEISVDPQVVARLIRSAIHQSDRIHFFGDTWIDRVERCEKNGFRVIKGKGGEEQSVGGYDHVVNALWEGRLRVDARLGLNQKRPFLNRYKLAVHASVSNDPEPHLTSATMILGPFGDIVAFGKGRYYLSWYPVCRIGASGSEQPPDWSAEITDDIRCTVLSQTVENLAMIAPRVRELDFTADTRVDGGVIFAWGSGDVADRDSELHQRFDIGVHSYEKFHSIDTGKYSMAPYFAREVAVRIYGR